MENVSIVLSVLIQCSFYLEVEDYMWIHIYRVDETLPAYLIADSLECNCLYDIDPGIYKKIGKQWVDYSDAEKFIEALENEQVETEIKFVVSDILEMLPDSEMLNMNIILGEDNFLVITTHGVERIAIDKAAVFRELSLNRLQELFNMKNYVDEV